MMNSRFKGISQLFLFTCIVIKIIFSCFVYLDSETKEPRFSTSFKKTINNDEIDIASRAFNLRNGRGMAKTIVTSDSVIYRLSSYRPILTVGMHYLYQNIYNHFSTLKENQINKVTSDFDRHNWYYTFYSAFLNYTSLLFFLISIPFFMYLARRVGMENNALVNVMTGLYLIFPSTLIYIGSIPLYENITLPVSVIMIAYLLKLLKKETADHIFTFIMVSLMIIFALMIRPQALVPTVFVFLAFGIYTFSKTIKETFFHTKMQWKFLLIFFTIFSMFQSSAFITNYIFFNKVFYTNRGDALLWGHNDLAKGSWDGTFDIEGSEGYVYQRKIIPGFDNMSEIEQSKAQQDFAVAWMKNNLGKEIKLSLKKIAIFFMPYNFESMKLSYLMALIHVGFIFYCIYFLKKMRFLITNPAVIFTMLFVLGVLLVNVAFFVEYRIKYFSDPFLIIFFGVMLEKLYTHLNGLIDQKLRLNRL